MPETPINGPANINARLGTGATFLLSVAINEYASENINNLTGCLADAEQLLTQLQRSYGLANDHICVLRNEEATRANIINQFRAHFGRLQAGDTAIFHYSGHGAQEPAHPAFVEAEIENPGGYNEVLVVHDYGREGVYNIADKELRLLISELQSASVGQAGDLHFVGLMDCCFSGSIYRTDRQVRRTVLGVSEPRPLSAYLDGYYARQQQEQGSVKLPVASFSLLTACNPSEYALEDTRGGLFTAGLCQLLEESQTRESLTYADLHTRLYHLLDQRTRGKQHPYLECSGRANPFQIFLGQQIGVPPALPKLIQKGEDWIVPLGALHGVRGEAWRDKRPSIYQDDQVVGTAVIDRVELEHTVVQVRGLHREVLPNQVTPLRLGIYPSSLALRWEVADHATKVATQLRQVLARKGLSPQLREQPDALHSLQFDEVNCYLFRGAELIIGIAYTRDVDYVTAYLAEVLQQIVWWEQINAIRPPRRTSISATAYNCTFSYQDNLQQRGETAVYPDGEEGGGVSRLTIPFSVGQKYLTFRFEIQNLDDHPCYYYLVHLGRKYEMRQLLEAFDKPLNRIDRRYYDSAEDGLALGFTDPQTKETTDIFLLFCARAPLVSPYHFVQQGIGELYGQVVEVDRLRSVQQRRVGRSEQTYPAPQWTMKRLELSLVKQ